jgi:hypothetical protein
LINRLGLLRVSLLRCCVVTLAVLAITSGVLSATTNPLPQLDPIAPNAVAPGTIGYTLTVTGTGFVSGSSIVWNGSPLATTFISASKLTAAISASLIATANTASINVFSPAPGGGYSNTQYFETTLFYSQIYFTDMSITGKNNLTSPVVGADFNLDGNADLAVASGGTVYVMFGNGDGTVQRAIGTAGPANGNITGLKVAPYLTVSGTAAPWPSLIVTGSKGTSTSFVATMVSNGNGTFQAPIESDFSFPIPQTAVVGDFNRDGILDLAFSNTTSVQVLLGNGDGTFKVGPSTALTQVGRDTVGVGDFNRDGNLDLVVTVFDPYSLGFNYTGVLLGNGDGTFAPLSEVAGAGTSFAGAITAVVGDFNNDGNLDIATAIQSIGQLNQGYLLVSLGNGNGTFQSASQVEGVTSITTPLLLADFNGDGNLDLATNGSIYYGGGNGTFPYYGGSSTAPTLVLALDMNGDGLPDILDETYYVSGSQVLTAVGLELQTQPLPDFKGIIAPFNSTMSPGGSVVIPVTVEPLNGWTGDVVISATDLPNGMTPSYNPVVVKGGNGTSTITLSTSPAVPLGQYNVTLSGNSGALTHSTVATITVTASPGDFTGSVVQNALNTQPGGSVAYTVSVQPLYGFTGSVLLNVSGLPAGTTASFNPSIITGGSGTSTLTVQTSSLTPAPSVSNLTISGTNGNLVHNAVVDLGVSNSTGDFTGSLSTSLQSVSSSAGGLAMYNIALSPINGGAGDVTLSVAGLPGNSVATFDPQIVNNGSGVSTLYINVPVGTATGSYPLVITGTASGVVHVIGATLAVNP